MANLKLILFILVAILLNSCKTEMKYTYTIKDFRKPLQPLLYNIVSKGIVSFFDTTLEKIITDQELKQLKQSEHPVLRTWGIKAMLYRESFNHFDIMKNHLDDTAIVGFDHGEFGILYNTISDEIIQGFEWKNIKEKEMVINEVITKHNYLKSAYSILSKIEPQEKYYPYIKDMATRNRKYDPDYGEQGFDDIEYALYGLAKFKKKENIKIIKAQLLQNSWRMSNISFKLMEEFPDSTYLDVFEKYFPHEYYQSICRSRDIFKATSFIYTVAAYKNVRSSKILTGILNPNKFANCAVGTNYIREELVDAIWNNKCEAYSKLQKETEKEIQKNKRTDIEPSPAEPINSSKNILPKSIRYW